MIRHNWSRTDRLLLAGAILFLMNIAFSFATEREVNSLQNKVEHLEASVTNLEAVAEDITAPDPEAVTREELRSVFAVVFQIRELMCLTPNITCPEEE